MASIRKRERRHQARSRNLTGRSRSQIFDRKTDVKAFLDAPSAARDVPVVAICSTSES